MATMTHRTKAQYLGRKLHKKLNGQTMITYYNYPLLSNMVIKFVQGGEWFRLMYSVEIVEGKTHVEDYLMRGTPSQRENRTKALETKLGQEVHSIILQSNQL